MICKHLPCDTYFAADNFNFGDDVSKVSNMNSNCINKKNICLLTITFCIYVALYYIFDMQADTL